jgi:hypothetical protein
VSDNKDLLQIGILLISSLILLTVFKDTHYLNEYGEPIYPKSPIDLDNIMDSSKNIYSSRNAVIFLMIATFVLAITAFTRATILSSLITIRDLIKRQISITHIEYVNIGIAFIVITVFILLSMQFSVYPIIIGIGIISIFRFIERRKEKKNSSK